MSRIEAGTKLYVVADVGRHDQPTMAVHELLVIQGGTKQIRIKPVNALGYAGQLTVIDEERQKKRLGGPFDRPQVHLSPKEALRYFIANSKRTLAQLQRNMTEVSNNLNQAESLLATALESPTAAEG